MGVVLMGVAKVQLPPPPSLIEIAGYDIFTMLTLTSNALNFSSNSNRNGGCSLGLHGISITDCEETLLFKLVFAYLFEVSQCFPLEKRSYFNFNFQKHTIRFQQVV